MRVTQAYRNLILEQEFEDKAYAGSPADTAVRLVQKLDALTHEANLIFNKLIKISDRRYFGLQIMQTIPPLKDGDAEILIYTEKANKPDRYRIPKFPIANRPEKEQVIKIVNKLRKIYILQIGVIETLREMNLAPNFIKDGKWQFSMASSKPQ